MSTLYQMCRLNKQIKTLCKSHNHHLEIFFCGESQIDTGIGLSTRKGTNMFTIPPQKS